MKYSVITFGCRVNQADSLVAEDGLLAQGHEAVAPDRADLVIVNTCSVTASADQAARQSVRRVHAANPSARIIVTGCYATRRPDEVALLPGVAQILPNPQKLQLPFFTGAWHLADTPPSLGAWHLAGTSSTVTTAERFGDGEGGCGLAVAPGVAGRTAFTLRVQTGCAEPCSYCIIPTTRGTPVSDPIDRVLEGVDRAAGAGFKEIALTGVHLGSYGRDLSPRASLVELLHRLADQAEGTDRLFRISSLEPMDCTPDVIALVSTRSCFAPHFHLPLQHASRDVLTAMRRPYTADRFAATVDDIRARLPHAAIGSDVIVGFPGETDHDFDQLVDYLERSPLTHLHVFPYSDRPGTVASAMLDRVPGTVVRDRGARIRGIGRRLSEAFRAGQIGTTHQALTLDDGTTAVTGNYLKVRIPPGRNRNEWITVRIDRDGDGLAGEVLNSRTRPQPIPAPARAPGPPR